jgi:hypothetical protein
VNLTKDGNTFAASEGPAGSSLAHTVLLTGSANGAAGALMYVRHQWAAVAIAAILNADAAQPAEGARPGRASTEQEAPR